MPDMYSNIGFNIQDGKDIYEFYRNHQKDILCSGEYSTVLGHGKYGLRYYFMYTGDIKGEVYTEYAAPVFIADASIKVTPTELECEDNDFPLLYADTSLCPLIISVRDEDGDKIKLGKPCNISITLFPDSIEYYGSEDEYYNGTKSHMAAESIIPFPVDKDDDNMPRAIINGKICDVRVHENIFTHMRFYEIIISVLGDKYTICADAEYFSYPPQKNGIIHGVFCITGMIL